MSTSEEPAHGATRSYEAKVLARARAVLDQLPEQIGPYRILERLGGGGMGEVYRAEQRSPIRREVALKLIKLGMDTKLVIARFEAERQALAMMDHPHIAKVFDAGAEETGRPYFIMEYVKGRPITEYADQNHLTIQERLELFEQVCHAIQHAHHKGVIHRDLKPSNVLVSTQDGKPFAKVIDFGVAKAIGQSLTEKTLYTQHEQLLGTPLYMSPEQAEGNLDIDTRTDVYSLGVLLYELLAGSTPFTSEEFRAAALDKFKRIICEVDPPKPSTRISMSGNTLPTLAAYRRTEPKKLGSLVRGELDWIVMKSLEKDRARRYDTPASLAEDVQRYLTGQPVVAAPPSWAYRARKFVKRYRLPLAAGAAFTAVLVVAIIAISSLAIRLDGQVNETRLALTEAKAARDNESQQRQEAERQRAAAESAARQTKYESARTQAQYLIQQNLLDQALVQAKEAYKLNGGWEDGLLIDRIVSECRKNWDIAHIISVSERPLAACVAQADGKRQFLIVSFGSSLAEYDLTTGKLKQRCTLKRLATRLVPFRGPSDRLIALNQHEISVISLSDLSQIADAEIDKDEIVGVDRGRTEIAVTLSNETVQVYDNNLTLLDSVPWPPEAKKVSADKPLTLNQLAISPDGRWIIAGTPDSNDDCLIWDRKAKTTTLKQLTSGFPKFIDDQNLMMVGANNVRAVAKHATIGGDGQPTEATDFGTLRGDDVGMVRAFAINATGMQIVGQFGVGFLVNQASTDLTVDSKAQRYTTIFGTANVKPDFLCLADDGLCFVLYHHNSLLIFQGKVGVKGFHIRGTNADLGPTAMYTFDGNNKSLVYRCTPTDPTIAPLKQTLPKITPAIEGGNTFGCGIAISSDQRTLAIRLADADGPKGTIHEARVRRVVVYHGLNPTNGAPSGESPTVIMTTIPDAAALNADLSDWLRILELSADGRFLLVGTRQSPISVAELFDAFDGKLLHQWTMDNPLGGVVTAIPGANCFADLAPDNKSIRLIEWSTGIVQRQLPMPGPVAWFCASNNGREIVASIQHRRIARFDLDSGKTIATIESELLPLAWSPENDVFVGYSDDERNQGTFILADCKTGDLRAVLVKKLPLGTPVKFNIDGRTLMYTGETIRQNDGVLLHNLSPEMADRRLSLALIAPAESDHSHSAAIADANPQPATDPSLDSPIDADDSKRLREALNTSVSVQGIIVAVRPTRSGDRLNVFLNSEQNGFQLYVPPDSMAGIRAKSGGDPTLALVGKHVVVTGEIVEFHGHLEIVIKDPSQIEIANSRQDETQPGPVSKTNSIEANSSADKSSSAGSDSVDQPPEKQATPDDQK